MTAKKSYVRELPEVLEYLRIVSIGRKKLKKRDAAELISIDTEAVGNACKEFFSIVTEQVSPAQMTDAAWKAYDLLIHLFYEDWGEEEVIAIGTKANV